ncbi:hypothetical protein [Sphingobium yanoikuyae]|uniref:hypothetical protein n=1 Tax=Sphingobium yanoikuyae TaxID=13690 RepID=UPI0026F09D3E|nr:hypothetical protein [Sphingobium yanoikuyae]
MSRRFDAARGGHHHLAWESQPLIQATVRRRGFTLRAIAAAFLVGLVLGLLL